MTRSLLSLMGPSTLFISLIATGIVPKASRASLDVVGDPFLNLDPASYDYIDAHGLPVDFNEYAWGGYAKKRNTAVRSTSVLHHPRAKHAQLLSRQAQCTPFQTTCLGNGGCCPNTKVCCLGVIAQGNCCNPGQICIGATTCCDQNQIGCGEACCSSGQECCGRKCCNTSSGFQCTNSECVPVSANSTSSTTSTSSSSSSSLLSIRTTTSATTSSTGDSFDSSTNKSTTDNSKLNLSNIITIVGAIAGISIAIGVVVYLFKRNRQRRRLAEIQRAAQGQNFQQPPPNSVTEPMYQMTGTPWARPTQVLPTSGRIPSYYAENSSATNMVSWQNQQFSLQPSTTANSEYNSTNGGSSDYHVQPWATPTSTHQQGINTPWMEGSNASESQSGEMSGTGLGRQNTKARYLTATQREEEAWEAKRREARTVGASTALVNTPSNGSSTGWATDDLGSTDPPVPGGVPDLPPPAYSEHQPHGRSHAI